MQPPASLAPPAPMLQATAVKAARPALQKPWHAPQGLPLARPAPNLTPTASGPPPAAARPAPPTPATTTTVSNHTALAVVKQCPLPLVLRHPLPAGQEQQWKQQHACALVLDCSVQHNCLAVLVNWRFIDASFVKHPLALLTTGSAPAEHQSMLASSWMVRRFQQLPCQRVWQRLLRSWGLHRAACLPSNDPIVERPLRRLQRSPAAGQQGQPFSANLQVGPPRPHFLTPLQPHRKASAKPMLSRNFMAALSMPFAAASSWLTVLGLGGNAALLAGCHCNLLFQIANV
jgi:hypothetical protein